MTTKTFDQKIKKLFPPDLAPFDYMGYLTLFDKPIKRVSVAVGLSGGILQKAIKTRSDLLLVHNCPEDLKVTPYYSKIRRLACRHHLCLYRAHLPLDFAPGGLIDSLCLLLHFKGAATQLNYQSFLIAGGVYLVKTKMAFNQLMNRFRKIAPPTIRIAGAKGNFFQSLAITTGDGCKPEFLEQLKPDAFICGLFNQESVRIADDLGITLFELTSHATENEPLKLVFDRLKKIFNPLELEFLEKEDTIICYNNK